MASPHARALTEARRLAAAIGCDRRHPSDEGVRRCNPLHSDESSNQEPLLPLAPIATDAGVLKFRMSVKRCLGGITTVPFIEHRLPWFTRTALGR
jgi:hypothetical protein